MHCLWTSRPLSSHATTFWTWPCLLVSVRSVEACRIVGGEPTLPIFCGSSSPLAAVRPPTRTAAEIIQNCTKGRSGRREGRSCRWIARDLGISQNTVPDALRRHGQTKKLCILPALSIKRADKSPVNATRGEKNAWSVISPSNGIDTTLGVRPTGGRRQKNAAVQIALVVLRATPSRRPASRWRSRWS